MAILGLIRLVAFGAALLFSLIVLGLAGHIISITFNGTFAFAALGVASAVLTFVTLLPMLVIDFLRAGAFTSFVWFELAVVGVLWVLWLATAGESVTQRQDIFGTNGCSDFFFNFDKQICGQFSAVEAFSFLIWIILLAYFVALLVFAIRAHTQHNRAWTTSVRSGFTTPASGAAYAGPGVLAEPKVVEHAAPVQQYPPQPQQMQQPVAQPAYGGPSPAPVHPGYGQV